MNSPSNEVFRLSWRSPLFLVFMLIFSVLSYNSWPNSIELILQFIVISVTLFLGSNVSINQYGIRLYYINKLEWHNIKSAESKSFFGLPYLLITRNNGLSWWLPLYFRGSRSMLAALSDWAPENNPLKNDELNK